MKNIKSYLIIAIVLLFQGCTISSFNANKPAKQPKAFQKTISVKEQMVVKKTEKKIQQNKNFIDIQSSQKIEPIKRVKLSGSIKGVIEKLKFDKNKKAWLYEVQAVNTSNGKLPFAKFYYYKKLANKGDLVYIILNNSQLQNLFFIKKVNRVRKKISHTKNSKKLKKTHKRSKYRKVPNIALPAVEHIAF
ncbi:MAG: hypothetical protein L3J44_01060 [Campylobacteraceae bacterium]|nr:hypothetical protein [Campylobacteraceae bacterium]